tara:strand:+ start:371 stop:679 length:309 start_codon:yes stop_codon:yes gene_type:complete
VAEGYYSFPQGEHVVFYLIGGEGIDIIGIPHKEMDIITYFLAGRIIRYKVKCLLLPASARHSLAVPVPPTLLSTNTFYLLYSMTYFPDRRRHYDKYHAQIFL